MKYGTIVQFFPNKGFGFIRADDGDDVFFHVTAIGGCEERPHIEAGQMVKYELAPSGETKAVLVELTDHIPDTAPRVRTEGPSTRHPRARQKKPTWRR